MMKRILSFILFLVTLSITIRQLVTGGDWRLVVPLATLSGAFLLITIFPFFRWGYRMIKLLWRAWRHPREFLYVRGVQVNLSPGVTSGKDFEWVCGLEIVSALPWSRNLRTLQVNITKPEDMPKMCGTFKNIKLGILSASLIANTRFTLSQQAHDYLEKQRSSGINYLPITLIIEGRGNKDELLLYEVIEPLITKLEN